MERKVTPRMKLRPWFLRRNPEPHAVRVHCSRSALLYTAWIYATIFIAVGSFRMIPNSPFLLKRLRSGRSGSASHTMD